MWSYYGSKSKIVNYYPPPRHGKIIEPFAGTAQYALRYFDRDVLLLDKYEVIVRIWKWLQQCSRQDILGLPRLHFGQNVDELVWDCDEAKWLVGMIISGAPTQPKKTAVRWRTVLRPNTQNYKLHFIASSLFKIRHWDVRLGSFEELPNEVATWFIDPPYQFGGEYYVKSNRTLDYSTLSAWCQSRWGQVLVCENTRANWLPFQPLTRFRGIRYDRTEAIWSNVPMDNVPLPCRKIAIAVPQVCLKK